MGRQKIVVRRRDEIVLLVEVEMWSLIWRRLSQRLWWVVEVAGRIVDDSSLIWERAFLLQSRWAGAVLWQLNYGSYGTFEFDFVENSAVRFALVFMGRSEGDADAVVTLMLHGIGQDEGANACGGSWGKRRDDLNIFLFFVVVVILADWRQRRNRVMNNQPTLFIFLVFHVENLNLFLLLLSVDVSFLWLHRKCFIVVLNDDFNDRF